MPQLKIGVELACLRLPPKKALHIVAQLGADAVEIDARGELSPRQLSQTGLRELRKMLDDFRLKGEMFKESAGEKPEEETETISHCRAEIATRRVCWGRCVISL